MQACELLHPLAQFLVVDGQLCGDLFLCGPLQVQEGLDEVTVDEARRFGLRTRGRKDSEGVHRGEHWRSVGGDAGGTLVGSPEGAHARSRRTILRSFLNDLHAECFSPPTPCTTFVKHDWSLAKKRKS